MEAASRWETEAVRETRDRRRGRPIVSQDRAIYAPEGDWRTLREVSETTGIPIGTLRKWCRRESVDSYLESDGEQTLRMLEMGSVRNRATAVGRDLGETPTGSKPQAASSKPESTSQDVRDTEYGVRDTADEVGPSTMIVPVDAWNKMLNQLGNLHEAGQQLAEARERAAKAETETTFLRERLAELRESQEPRAKSQEPASTPVPPAHEPSFVRSESSSSPSGGGAERSEAEGVEQVRAEPPDPPPGLAAGLPPEGGEERAETTSFFRYIVRGWRGRRR